MTVVNAATHSTSARFWRNACATGIRFREYRVRCRTIWRNGGGALVAAGARAPARSRSAQRLHRRQPLRPGPDRGGGGPAVGEAPRGVAAGSDGGDPPELAAAEARRAGG